MSFFTEHNNDYRFKKRFCNILLHFQNELFNNLIILTNKFNYNCGGISNLQQ